MGRDFETRVFVSYSRRDSDVMALLMDAVSTVEHKDRLNIFVDTDLEGGDLWLKRIRRALSELDVAILLVSDELLRSKFVGEIEMPSIRRSARDCGAVVLPVLVSSCSLPDRHWLRRHQFVGGAELGLRDRDDAGRKSVLDELASRLTDIAKRSSRTNRFLRRWILNWRFVAKAATATVAILASLGLAIWYQVQAPQVRAAAGGIPLSLCQAEQWGSVAQPFERGWLIARFDTNEFIAAIRREDGMVSWRRYDASEFAKGAEIACPSDSADRFMKRGFRWLYCNRAPELIDEMGAPLSDEVRAWLQYQTWSSGLFVFGLPSSPQPTGRPLAEFQILSGVVLANPEHSAGEGRYFAYSEGAAEERVYCTALWYPAIGDGSRNPDFDAIAAATRCEDVVDGQHYAQPRLACSLSGY